MSTHSTLEGRRLLVVGGSKGTGRLVAEQAARLGALVTVFCRSETTLPSGIAVIRGDVGDPDAVAAAVEGHDAVVVTLGAPGRDRSGIRERGTRHVVEAMARHGVSRLVVQSTYGTHETRPLLPVFLKYVIVPLLLDPAFRDHERQERVVRDADLAWTIVRPTNLTDAEARGRYHHGFHTGLPRMRWKVPRADVAAFLLDQVCSDRYLRQTPAISE